MRFLFLVLICSVLQAQHDPVADASKLNDYKIARAVRRAVRSADSTLLKAHSLQPWRDYLKIATSDLEQHLQPLLLIKFDEDRSFRSQLKTIIDWESKWHKKATEHYIYYYRWDQPPPELIVEVQEAHFKEVSRVLGITPKEKIPFRYDLSINKNVVFPYEDLRGGIVSSQPFDLESGALALLYFESRAPEALLRQVARIYGLYFQNPSTAEAYYVRCMATVRKRGYRSIKGLFGRDHVAGQPVDAPSTYAFIYQLDREFGPQALVRFLKLVDQTESPERVAAHFQRVFGIDLQAFEEQFFLDEAVNKL